MDQSTQDFVTLVSSLGSAAGPVFGLLFWLERQERKEMAKAKDAVTERVIIAMLETSNSLNTLKSILGKV